MLTERLPETVQTLYAELLELTLQAEAQAQALGISPGSFVVKQIAGRRYWYQQLATGSTRYQRYLGPESPPLLTWMEGVSRGRAELAPDEAARARLVAMLIQGGAPAPVFEIARVLQLLAGLGVFRRGGVLVGTQAFQAYAALLGARFPGQALATQDIDVRHDFSLALALREEPDVGVAEALAGAGLGFHPVPALDHRLPPTSFKIRGKQLRVDFLVPGRRGRDQAPVAVPGLGVHAQPLYFLDYLLGETIPAVLVAGAGIPIRVPAPARFALHKLWLATERPAAEETRAGKDRRQAAVLLDLLAKTRPGDLLLAWDALEHRRSARERIGAELQRLAPSQAGRLLGVAG